MSAIPPELNDPEASPEARLAAGAAFVRANSPGGHAVCEVDLHIHSFYSDGYHSPTGRVVEAWWRGMKAVALTDHDNADGCAEALAAGEFCGLTVVAGIEFYTDRPGVEILGFWPQPATFRAWQARGAGREIIEPLREAKGRQLAAMLARVPACFSRRDFAAEITAEDIRRYVRNGVSTKGDISVIMWQKYGPELARRELAADVKEFQARYTTRDDELNVPLRIDLDLSPAAFVRRLTDWGALPGLAHPTELRKKEGLGNAALAELIEELGAVGLQTVEVDGWRNGRCPETGRPQTEVFAEMVTDYNCRNPERSPLLCTNGSDDHNQPGEGLELGCGRNDNLRPEYGGFDRVEALRVRASELRL